MNILDIVHMNYESIKLIELLFQTIFQNIINKNRTQQLICINYINKIFQKHQNLKIMAKMINSE